MRNNKDDWKDTYDYLKKNTKWLDKWGALLESGKYIGESAGEWDCAGTIEFSNYIAVIDKYWWSEGEAMAEYKKKKMKKAVMVHKACYELAFKKKKINWFNQIAPHLQKRYEGKPAKYTKAIITRMFGAHGYVSGIKYGKISNYIHQEYDYSQLILDRLKDPWFLVDPKKNPKNKKRIEGILTEILKKKPATPKKKDRPSPSESATQFPEGTKRKGGDGKMWIVKKNVNGVKQWRKL